MLLLERTRLRAEILYLKAEREAGLSPDARTRGAQELFDALTEIQEVLRETGRRVGVTIEDAHELFKSEVEGSDTDMSGAAPADQAPVPAQT